MRISIFDTELRCYIEKYKSRHIPVIGDRIQILGNSYIVIGRTFFPDIKESVNIYCKKNKP